MTDTLASAPGRHHLVVTGVVQGVGFRPFVYRLATEMGAAGTVANAGSHVVIDIEGEGHQLARFVVRLRAEAPPLAVIDEIQIAATGEPLGRRRFSIDASAPGADGETGRSVPPDTGPCTSCEAELTDPTNRRYGHPFISCTDCGPRFTIITGLPYDRPATTMAPFPLCQACGFEYHNPADRRFHAQPIGCHECGPRLRFQPQPGNGEPSANLDPVQAAVGLLNDGGIVAIKGVGGYQLACDATNQAAVQRLRARKYRPDKPFALLAANGEMVNRLVDLSPHEYELVASQARPILLAKRHPQAPVAEAVAPGAPLLGVMLAPSPLHLLVAAAFDAPLVLTSGNASGAPMCSQDERAVAELGPMVEGFLTHDRPIATACDDSVLRVVAGRRTFVRRARGYAPVAVAFEPAKGPVLATGGILKNTFCLTSGHRAMVSQHIGDLDNLAAVEAFGSSVAGFERFYETEATTIAVDAHPDAPGRAWVRRNRPNATVVAVQHHHAHIASVLAENAIGSDVSVLGLAFDGTGYGPCGAVWGGEALAVTGATFQRVGHLLALPLPGGDAAVVNPYRIALAYLQAAGVTNEELPPAREAEPAERRLLSTQLKSGFGCAQTSSMGRLFDAVSSLVGLRHRITYEAQGAIELELAAVAALKSGAAGCRYGFPLSVREHGAVTADPRPLIGRVAADVEAGVCVGEIALGFHRAVAALIVGFANAWPEYETVVLSGGVFQNGLLVELAVPALEAQGRTVLVNTVVPPNDGGLSLGQAYIASATRTAAKGDPPCV